MLVVSDNSPLQYLVLIDCIETLPALYGVVLTTPEVVNELQHARTPPLVRAWADSLPAWLSVESPSKVDFREMLDIGEASAISLARERNADLVLIDERAGTNTARSIGIAAIGTLGILVEAGLEGFIEFDSALDRLTSETAFYASNRLVEAARRLFHERKHKTK
jgi:predicted nucleic acid-binding protein